MAKRKRNYSAVRHNPDKVKRQGDREWHKYMKSGSAYAPHKGLTINTEVWRNDQGFKARACIGNIPRIVGSEMPKRCSYSSVKGESAFRNPTRAIQVAVKRLAAKIK